MSNYGAMSAMYMHGFVSVLCMHVRMRDSVYSHGFYELVYFEEAACV